MSRELRLAVFLALPVLGIAFGIVRAETHVAAAKRFVFDVTGFDPRDLLQGHYLQYRVTLTESGSLSSCQDQEPDCALCVHALMEGAPPALQRFDRRAGEPSCDATISTMYLDRLQRFYIPEARALELTDKLRIAADRNRAQLVVAVDGQGVPRAEVLELDGEEVRQR